MFNRWIINVPNPPAPFRAAHMECGGRDAALAASGQAKAVSMPPHSTERQSVAQGHSAPCVLAAGLAVLLGPIIAWCCGPFFPNTMLDDREQELLRSPCGDMQIEFSRIAPATAVLFKANPAMKKNNWDPTSRPTETATADLEELKAAISVQAVPRAQLDATLARYSEFRHTLMAFRNDRFWDAEKSLHVVNLELELPGQPVVEEQWNSDKKAMDTVKTDLPVLGEVAIPTGLPGEFEDYARGAVAYDQGKIDNARTAWNKLLDRPAKDRHYRSVWAAHMLARTYVKADPAKCVEWCGKTQEFAKAGFADSTELAVASLGLAGAVELKFKHYDRAIEFYLEQQATGDTTAPQSLRQVVWAILRDDPAAMKKVAADPKSRQVVAAYMVCQGGPYVNFDAKDKKKLAWLEAVEAADVKDMESADRLAWAAYTLGQPKIAQRWVDRAKADSPITQWVQAKLLLRAGKIDEAAGLLAKASKAFPKDQIWRSKGFADEEDGAGADGSPADRVAGELGVLRLARRQYVDSLDLLLRHDWWTDAAYVAERVLTVDELQEYVDANWPKKLAENCKPVEGSKSGQMAWGYLDVKDGSHPSELAWAIRWLLARRLTRGGQGGDARPYFPPDWREKLDDYVAALKIGQDPKQPDAKRADALWQAAKLARFSGMELMGAELGPDGFIYGGSFPVHTDRAAKPTDTQTVIAPPLRTKDEDRRGQASVIDPDKRFHYRYLAADLAWEAAKMMPDQDENTARVLCEAGLWIQNEDPKGADKFYKTLVRRCGQTALGKEADKLRWFPGLKK